MAVPVPDSLDLPHLLRRCRGNDEQACVVLCAWIQRVARAVLRRFVSLSPIELHVSYVLALALQPAQKPALFEVAEPSVPSRITEAPAHVGRAGRAGVVRIDFSNDRRGA